MLDEPRWIQLTWKWYWGRKISSAIENIKLGTFKSALNQENVFDQQISLKQSLYIWGKMHIDISLNHGGNILMLSL